MTVRATVGLFILAFLIVLFLIIFAIHNHLGRPLDGRLLLLARPFLARSLLSERELPCRGLSSLLLRRCEGRLGRRHRFLANAAR